jgi:Rieske Fe-S protein
MIESSNRGATPCAACTSCGHCDGTGNTPGLDRRDFLLAGARAAALLALSACGALGSAFPTSPGSVSATLALANYPTLGNTNGVALVSSNGVPLAIVRTGASSFEALSRICPHQGSVVNLSGSGFLCPNHGARFSLSGQWTGGQPTSGLYSYPTSYDATAGTLTVG